MTEENITPPLCADTNTPTLDICNLHYNNVQPIFIISKMGQPIPHIMILWTYCKINEALHPDYTEHTHIHTHAQPHLIPSMTQLILHNCLTGCTMK